MKQKQLHYHNLFTKLFCSLIWFAAIAQMQAQTPCTDFMPGPFNEGLGGPFTNVNPLPCGETCAADNTTEFAVFVGEAYLLLEVPQGNSYNLSICNGIGANSIPTTLTIAAYTFDEANDSIIIGEVVAVVDDCAIDFTAPATGDYILVLSEQGNCTGAAPIPTDNGQLSVQCLSVLCAANDIPSQATPIDISFGAVNGPFDNTGATTDENDPVVEDCFINNDPFDRTLWFTFEGNGTTVLLQTDTDCDDIEDDSEIEDTQIAIFELGADGSLNFVACSDDQAFNLLSEIILTTTEGATYLLVVDGFEGEEGQFCITAQEFIGANCLTGTTAVEPATDVVGTGTPADPYLVCADDPLSFSSLGDFTIDPSVLDAFTDPGIIWTVFLDQPTTTNIFTDPNATLAAMFTLGETGDTTFLVNNGTGSFALNGLTTGNYVLVPIINPDISGLNADPNCTGIDLSLTYPVFSILDESECMEEVCLYDNCASALAIDASIGTVHGPFDNNCNLATLDDPELPFDCFFADDPYSNTIWFSFEGTGDNLLVQLTTECEGLTGGIEDAQLAIYTGDCSGLLDLVTCDDDGGAGLLPAAEVITELGVTYYLLIDGFAGETGSFCISVDEAFVAECTVGTTSAMPPEDALGVGTPDDPYFICADEPIQLSAAGDFFVDPNFANPGIMWVIYTDQPTTTDPLNDPNSSLVLLADENGAIIFDNGTADFTQSGLDLSGTYVFVPIINPDIDDLGIDVECIGIDLAFTYPVFTFIDTFELACGGTGLDPCENNECVTATPIDASIGAVNGVFTNACATSEPSDPTVPPSCFFNDDPYASTVWFSFTGNGDNIVIEAITECEGITNPIDDTKMALYQGDCAGGLDLVTCDDDSGTGFLSGVIAQTVMGQDYLLVVDGFAGEGGEFCLAITQANDCTVSNECAEALPIVLADTTQGPFNNVCATSKPTDPSDIVPDCFGEDSLTNTVWFTFTGDGSVWELSTTNDCEGIGVPLTDTQLGVFEADCKGELVNCNDDVGFFNALSSVFVPTTAGTAYYVLVDGFGGATGDFCLNFAPASDCTSSSDCVDAITIDGAVGSINGPFSNTCAGADTTNQVPIDSCFFNSDPLTNTLWFTFVGDGATVIVATDVACDGIINGLEDTQMAIFADACDGEFVGCNDDTDGGVAAAIELATAAGVNYYVVVDGFGGGTGDFCLTVSSPVGCTESNECQNALTIDAIPDAINGPYNNACATSELSDPPVNPGCFFDDDPYNNTLWFTFVGDGTELRINAVTNCAGLNSPIGDAQLAIYEGDCDNALSLVACDDDSGVGLLPEVDVMTTTGSIYYVVVDGFDGETGEFCIQVAATPQPLPCSVGTTTALPPDDATGSGTTNDPYIVCADDPITLISMGDFVIDPAVADEFPNPGIMWALYTAQPVTTNALLDTNSTFTVLSDANGVIFDNGVADFSLTGEAPGTYVLVPIINQDVTVDLAVSEICSGIDLTITYPTFTFLAANECDQVPIECTAQAGTMPTDTVFVCAGNSSNVVASDNAQLGATDGVNYVLHTSSDANLGEVLAVQTDAGVFSIDATNDIAPNVVYYISQVAGTVNENGVVLLTDSCTSVSIGTPVVFLQAIEIGVTEDCDRDAGLATVLFQVSGGLPEFDNSRNYTVTGMDSTTITISTNQIDTLGVFANGANYTMTATDGASCEQSINNEVLCAPTVAVQLLSFEGEAMSTGNLLTWVTAAEMNTAQFIIERSTDGTNFSSLTEVAAAGNSTTTRSYEFLDKTAPKGISYYRLLEKDIEGKVTEQGMIQLVRGETPALALVGLSPNPATDAIAIEFISGQTGNVAAAVFDLMGRQVIETNVNTTTTNHTLSLNVAQLPAGTYILTLNNGQEVIKTQFIKQ